MKRVFVAMVMAALTLVCAGTASAGLGVSALGTFSNEHATGNNTQPFYCGPGTTHLLCSSFGIPSDGPNEAQARWGTASPSGGGTTPIPDKSGLAWLGASSLATAYETPFVLGKLTHFNQPIYNSIDSLDLTLHLGVTDGGASIISSDLPVQMLVDETPNGGLVQDCPYPSVTACSDRITWSLPPAQSVIPASPAGGPYVLSILGFKSNTLPTGTPVVNFISEEDQTNTAYLFAQLGAVGTGRATNDTYSTIEDVPLSAAAGTGLLGNDATPPLVATVSVQTPPSHGSVTVGSHGDFTYTPAAGYVGPDSFIYLAQYADGVLALARASITVDPDTTHPTFTTVPDLTNVEATGPSGASVSWAAPIATDPDDAAGAATCDPAAGSTFPLGPTTVTCSSTDTHGNTGTTSFTVTVVDTTKPSITCPADITTEATDSSGASVLPGAATASDLVSAVTITGPAAGTYPLGSTTVTYTATDAAGNSSSCTATISVVDTTKPVVHVPADITAEATSAGGAAASWAAVTATDAVGAGPVTCDHASGATYALGSTVVTCSATDSSGNTGTASFTVNVVDTTKPALTVPASFAVNATSSAGAVVTYTASASDLVDGALTPSCSPASGTTFGPGPTTVTCTATDAHGNTGTATFTVTVRSVPGMLSDLLLAANLPPGKSLPQKVKNAQAAYAANDIPTTCSILAAFMSEVSAQSGKALTVAQATDLLSRARQIRTALGC